MKFKVGDRVVMTNALCHKKTPHCYPVVGTEGTLVKKTSFAMWRVKWADGTTSEDDAWGCEEEYMTLLDAPKEMTKREAVKPEWCSTTGVLLKTAPQPEMTAREYQSELLRMMDAHGRTSEFCGGISCEKETCPLCEICDWQSVEAAICDPRAIDIVQRWSAEHPKPKPKPISASDYEKLKAVHILFGDCYVCKDESGLCCAHREEPIKHEKVGFWISDDGWVMERFVIDFLSWEDEEPLRLTEQWLKEVEHD